MTSLLKGLCALTAVAALCALAAGCDERDHDRYHEGDTGWYSSHPDWDGSGVEFYGTVDQVHDHDAGQPGWDAYRVTDGSHSVWVRSNHGAPNVGDHVSVRGTAHSDEHYGNDDLGPTVDEHDRHMQ